MHGFGGWIQGRERSECWPCSEGRHTNSEDGYGQRRPSPGQGNNALSLAGCTVSAQPACGQAVRGPWCQSEMGSSKVFIREDAFNTSCGVFVSSGKRVSAKSSRRALPSVRVCLYPAGGGRSNCRQRAPGGVRRRKVLRGEDRRLLGA